MRLHGDWAAASFHLRPHAELSGPFPTRPFLEVLWEHRGGEPLFAESGDALLALTRRGETLEMMGEPDLTDYHAPLGDRIDVLAHDLAGELDAGTRLVWDSLPGEATEPLVAGLAKAGVTARSEVHQVAAILDLPDDHDQYLARIGAKQRHEVRRKDRRFREAFGDPLLTRHSDREALRAFVAMHRSAAGDKGGFMTPEMEEVFADLLARVPGARIDVLSGTGGEPVAAAFGFGDDRAYYLYNSAFDPAAGHVSPGVVLVDRLIAGAIEDGCSRFDFLKGDEAYKFRLGAVERPLHRVEAVL